MRRASAADRHKTEQVRNAARAISSKINAIYELNESGGRFFGEHLGNAGKNNIAEIHEVLKYLQNRAMSTKTLAKQFNN